VDSGADPKVAAPEPFFGLVGEATREPLVVFFVGDAKRDPFCVFLAGEPQRDPLWPLCLSPLVLDELVASLMPCET
jgi:hypothetical protein